MDKNEIIFQDSVFFTYFKKNLPVKSAFLSLSNRKKVLFMDRNHLIIVLKLSSPTKLLNYDKVENKAGRSWFISQDVKLMLLKMAG